MAKTIKQKKKRSFKFLWAIGMLILFPVVFNLLSATMTKRYSAEMRLMVDESTEGTQIATGPFANLDAFQIEGRPRSAQTQLDVLTGTTVLENAYQLAADRMPEKFSKSGNPAKIYEDMVNRLAVDNEPNSDILSIRVTEDDPEVAAELANDIGLAYIDYSKKIERESGTLMSDQLSLQIKPLRAKLAAIDAQISEIKQKANIYDINAYEGEAGSTKEAADRQVAAALANYDGGKAQLAVAESELAEVPKYIQTGTHTQLNPVLVTLQPELAAENVSLAQLRAQYQENFPLVKEEEQKIADLKKQMKAFRQYVSSGEDRSINPVYQTQVSNLAQLKAQVQGYALQLTAAQQEQQRSTQAVEKIPEAEQKLQALTRDRTTYEQTYEQLAQRQATALNSLEAQRPPAEVVSPALPPPTPSFPDHKLLTMTGLALGIFFAVMILMPRPQVVTTATEIPEAREPFTPPSPEPEPPTVDSLPATSEPVQEAPKPDGAQALGDAIKRARAPRGLKGKDPEALSSGSGNASSS
jgi:uncharacterized protein involved in exopolysaccharide biosynthesis